MILSHQTNTLLFFLRGSGGELVFSSRIRGKDIKNLNSEVYRARTEQVTTVDLSAPVAGQEYTISVIDTSDKEILTNRQNKRSYTHTAGAGETAV